jgi:hypothetical protein
MLRPDAMPTMPLFRQVAFHGTDRCTEQPRKLFKLHITANHFPSMQKRLKENGFLEFVKQAAAIILQGVHRVANEASCGTDYSTEHTILLYGATALGHKLYIGPACC